MPERPMKNKTLLDSLSKEERELVTHAQAWIEAMDIENQRAVDAAFRALQRGVLRQLGMETPPGINSIEGIRYLGRQREIMIKAHEIWQNPRPYTRNANDRIITVID